MFYVPRWKLQVYKLNFECSFRRVWLWLQIVKIFQFFDGLIFFKTHCFCQRETVTSTLSPLFGPFKHPSLIQEKSIHGVGENLDSLAWAFLPVLSRPWALWEHVSLLCTKMSSFYGPDGLHGNMSLFLTYRSWQNQLNQLWHMENTSGDTDDN